MYFTVVKAATPNTAAYEACRMGLFGDWAVGDVWIEDSAGKKYWFTVSRWPVNDPDRTPEWNCGAKKDVPDGYTVWNCDVEPRYNFYTQRDREGAGWANLDDFH